MARHTSAAGFSRAILNWGQLQAVKNDAIRREALRIFMAEVIVGGQYSPGTPVRTGKARDSWSGGGPGYTPPAWNAEKAPRDDTGFAALATVFAAIDRLKPGEKFVAWNPAPYIVRLEYDGWSDQAPSGMLRLAIRAWPSIVRRATATVRKQQGGRRRAS